MYSDNDLLPISALQHLLFCERQCALIHIERLWNENWLTAQGRILHERVHEQKAERRKDIRTEFGLELRSYELGLFGKADVVEFYRIETKGWRPFPVEYKRGKQKPDNRDTVQLCAQAMCLEEMLNAQIPLGAIYYGKEHKRVEIIFDENIRKETRATASMLHDLVDSGRTPSPHYEEKCDSCSLYDLCLPKQLERNLSVEQFLKEASDEAAS